MDIYSELIRTRTNSAGMSSFQFVRVSCSFSVWIFSTIRLHRALVKDCKRIVSHRFEKIYNALDNLKSL